MVSYSELAPSENIHDVLRTYAYLISCHVGISYFRCRRFNEGARSQAH